MKTKYFISTLLLLVLTLSSCRDITIKTKVNADGSFTRVITLSGNLSDSASVVKMEGLPYPVDDSWEMKTMRDTSDSTRLICIYAKDFPGDEALREEIGSDTSWMKMLDREITIKKKFMFFYSYLTYRELYRKADPSKLLDYRDYMSPADLEWVIGNKSPLTGSDSTLKDSADARAERYIMASYRAEIIDCLEKGIQRLDDPEIRSFAIKPFIYSNFNFSDLEQFESPDHILDSIASKSGIRGLLDLKELSPPVFSELEKKLNLFEKIIGMEDYTSEVEMPGLITATNSSKLVGNTVSWFVQPTSFYFDDYEMFVESRVVNRWAFVLSGAVLLLLIIVFVVRIFR